MTPSSWRLRARLARFLLWWWRFKEERLWHQIAGEIPTMEVVSRRFLGKQLHLELARSSTHWRLWTRGADYVPEIRVLESLVKRCDHVVDVGANIGYTTLALAGLVGKTGGVLCFEPDPENLRELQRNISENRLTNVIVIPQAAGATAGVARFRKGLNGTVDEMGELEVEMAPLDRAVRGRIDLIKIDVEGFEGEVLAGADALIERDHPTLFVEMHPRLEAGWTHRGITEWILERYPEVEALEISVAGDLISKIRARYLRPVLPGKVRLESILAECEAGERERTFWLLAKAQE